MAAMNAVLIALFFSAGAQGLPAPSGAGPGVAAPGIDGPAAPVLKLAGKARQIDAVIVGDPPAEADLTRPAIHSTGEKKRFRPETLARTIA